MPWFALIEAFSSSVFLGLKTFVKKYSTQSTGGAGDCGIKKIMWEHNLN